MELPANMPEGSTIDDDLPVSITHSHDIIVFDGRVEQSYNFLVYRFAGGEVARAYQDNFGEVSFLHPQHPEPITPAVLAYVQARFHKIKQLGGREGYVQL